MARCRFYLKTDITDFYGSIYTHALEWALHTKSAAKANLAKKGPKSTGSLLDDLIRNGQDGQTKGIPIGPDSSQIAAELLLCAIDQELVKVVPSAETSALRLSDDLEFFARQRGEAEEVLLAWDALLATYDLNLNHKKTHIIEGPIPPETPWKVVLSAYHLRQSPDSAVANDIRGLFSLAFDLKRRHEDDAVLSYAIVKCSSSVSFGKSSWREFFQLLLASAIVEPSSLKYVADALSHASRKRLGFDRPKLEEALHGLLDFHAPLEHGSEVAWSLSILRGARASISSEAAAKVAQMRDNCSLILLQDLLASGYCSGPLPDMSGAVARAEDELAYKSEDWLLAYEFVRNRWASDKHLSAAPQWKELLDLDIAFYRQITAPAPSHAGPSLGRREPSETLHSGTEGKPLDTGPSEPKRERGPVPPQADSRNHSKDGSDGEVSREAPDQPMHSWTPDATPELELTAPDELPTQNDPSDVTEPDPDLLPEDDSEDSEDTLDYEELEDLDGYDFGDYWVPEVDRG